MVAIKELSILKARFIDRPNRFSIRCNYKGKIISAFLPNPGRLQELLLPGRVIYLEKEKRLNRKTRYTVLAVLRNGHPIVLHTDLTNLVARNLLERGKIPTLRRVKILKSEIKVGKSRFDFLLSKGKTKILLEVKSCTLVSKRVAMFPDAVTERGKRHLEELSRLVRRGMKAAVLFVVHSPSPKYFMPNYHTDLEFSKVFLKNKDKVKFIPISICWRKDLSITGRIKLLKILWDYVKEKAEDRGSYLLVLNLERDKKICIKGLGKVYFQKGFYVYVGSAMRNLTKRIQRHRLLRKRHHWHIDELRRFAKISECLAIRSSKRLECEIVKGISEIASWSITDFGSSDCSCKSHLFGFEKNPLNSISFHNLLQYFRMDKDFSSNDR